MILFMKLFFPKCLSLVLSVKSLKPWKQPIYVKWGKLCALGPYQTLLMWEPYVHGMASYFFSKSLPANVEISYLVLSGDAVVNVYINHEKKFAFVEMRSVEEASNAMALDGIIFEVLGSYKGLGSTNMFLHLL